MTFVEKMKDSYQVTIYLGIWVISEVQLSSFDKEAIFNVLFDVKLLLLENILNQ